MVPKGRLGTIWYEEFQQPEIVVIYFLFAKACDPVCDPIVAQTYVKIQNKKEEWGITGFVSISDLLAMRTILFA